MKWKEQLNKYEHKKDWKAATNLIDIITNNDPDNVEAYVRVIYLLHRILVDEDYPESEHDHMANLLKQYFRESVKKFSENSEYLFFIGKLLYIADWYFGIDDDFKPVVEKQAFNMQKKAFELEPSNALFEWAYRYSLEDTLAKYLAEQILLYDQAKIEWLKSKGFPGNYILEALKRSKKN